MNELNPKSFCQTFGVQFIHLVEVSWSVLFVGKVCRVSSKAAC